MLIGIFYSQIVESSSLVSVLFREVISHPYISFFHLLVSGFSVTCIYISVTKFLRKIRATTFTERLRKITREGPGTPGMSNAASN